jgi:hypothetical protein
MNTETHPFSSETFTLGAADAPARVARNCFGVSDRRALDRSGGAVTETPDPHDGGRRPRDRRGLHEA